MSDTAAVAPSAAPAPSAPASNEAVINQNPTHSPAPLGPQTPSKTTEPVSSPHHAESRRDSIRKAFERAQNAEPAKPRMGHNNPPEAMQREPSARERREAKEKPEPLDLKKRPADQPPRERGDHGHFAPREPAAPAAPRQNQALPGQHKQLPEGTPFRDAPQRMSEGAKAQWADTPEHVRGEVHRMQQEFGRAYQQYRADAQEMNSIRQFSQLARSQGTTLQRALSNYVGMEHKLRQDVVGGLDVIVNNLNLRSPDGQRLTLHDIAWHIVNQSPEQRQLLQSQNTQMAQSHQLQAAHQRIAALENQARAMQHREVFAQTRAGVDQYAATHPRLDELGDLIEQEVKLGFDLDTAYRRAEMLRPATHAAQTRNGNGTSPAAQTRNPGRSIHGAPGGSPNGAQQQRRPEKQIGRREAIANAIKRVGNAL